MIKKGDIIICKINSCDFTSGKSYKVRYVNDYYVHLLTDDGLRCSISPTYMQQAFYSQVEIRKMKLNQICTKKEI